MVFREYLISATAKRFTEYRDFVSIDEKRVTQKDCSIGTPDYFAIVRVFDVSCWPWLQALNIRKIIISVGLLGTELDAALSNRK